MHLSIVKRDECVLLNCKKEYVKETRDTFKCHAFGGTEALIAALIVTHNQDIEPCPSVRRNGDILSGKLSAVWHATFGTGEASVSEIDINMTFTVLLFKLLQLLFHICAELRRGCPFGRFPYTSNFAPRLIKKLCTYHGTPPCLLSAAISLLAFMTMSLSFSMASLTASSSDKSITGLAPCPNLFQSPSTPCARYCLTQRLTLDS